MAILYSASAGLLIEATRVEPISYFIGVALEDSYAAKGEDVLITCSITQLLKTVTVQWRDTSGQVINSDSDYTVNQGSKDESGKQYSSLQILTTNLQSLGTTSVTYTCQVLSGDQTIAVSKSMTLTLYEFGKHSINFQYILNQYFKY